MRTKEIQIYTFDELSDKAKERARAWYRGCQDSTDLQHVIEDAVRMAAILGFEMRTHAVRLMGGGTRQDPTVWWQVGYMQSDGAWIEANYTYAKGAHRTIRDEAPEDQTLHDLADRLLVLQRAYAYGLTATINDDDRQTRIDLAHPTRTVDNGVYVEFREIVRTLEKWIYTQLRTEDEYQSADAQVDENIRANEYEFTVDGEIE
jgi:hypothetical protein